MNKIESRAGWRKLSGKTFETGKNYRPDGEGAKTRKEAADSMVRAMSGEPQMGESGRLTGHHHGRIVGL
jgi:hypothetical protein